jgi:hypothetical protein
MRKNLPLKFFKSILIVVIALVILYIPVLVYMYSGLSKCATWGISPDASCSQLMIDVGGLLLVYTLLFGTLIMPLAVAFLIGSLIWGLVLAVVMGVQYWRNRQ